MFSMVLNVATNEGSVNILVTKWGYQYETVAHIAYVDVVERLVQILLCELDRCKASVLRN